MKYMYIAAICAALAYGSAQGMARAHSLPATPKKVSPIELVRPRSYTASISELDRSDESCILCDRDYLLTSIDHIRLILDDPRLIHDSIYISLICTVKYESDFECVFQACINFVLNITRALVNVPHHSDSDFDVERKALHMFNKYLVKKIELLKTSSIKDEDALILNTWLHSQSMQ